MSFLERFNGRTSFMNKEGVTGIVAQKSVPIDKTPGTSQVNYFTPSNHFSGAPDGKFSLKQLLNSSRSYSHHDPTSKDRTARKHLSKTALDDSSASISL